MPRSAPPKGQVFDDPTLAGRILGYDKFEGTSESAVKLMLRVPYIMVLFYSLTFYISKKIQTLAVNGVACWVNPAFWAQLTREQRLTAIAHEIGHKMLMHPTRRGARDRVLWNMAGDYVINLMLVESGFAPLANLVIDGKAWSWLYDIKYAGMTTEQVYDALLKEIDDEAGEEEGQEPGEDAGPEGSGDGGDTESPDDTGSDDGSGGEEDGDADGGDTGENPDGDAEGGDGGVPRQGGDVQRTGKGKSGTGAGVQPRDGCGEVPDGGDGEAADGQHGAGQSAAHRRAEERLGPMRDLLDFGEDPEGEPYEDPDRPPESAAEFEERMKQELAAAESVAKMQGNVPGWMQRVMENSQHSKVPWPEILEQYLKNMTQADYSWRRWNKREYVKIGILSPDLYEPAMGGMVLFVDCSGSIGGRELSQFGGHFRDVLEQVKPKWVEVVYFDTQSYAPFDRFERAEFDEDTSRLKPKGGGGTSFTFFAQHIDEMDEQPEVAMCLTDMYGTFGRETSVPMLWLSNSSVEEAPYGAVISIA
jgi:predicted metal-dependent peptidase